jgi:hypothetical protein
LFNVVSWLQKEDFGYIARKLGALITFLKTFSCFKKGNQVRSQGIVQEERQFEEEEGSSRKSGDLKRQFEEQNCPRRATIKKSILASMRPVSREEKKELDQGEVDSLTRIKGPL